MSIVIIAFPAAPSVSEEAKRKEAELDARLESKIKGKISLWSVFISIFFISMLSV